MEAGKAQTRSPIIDAIAEAEDGTTGEIRVHLSKAFFEKDAFAHAQRLFREFQMFRTTHRNAVLLYINLRRRKFAIVGDIGIHEKVGQVFWEELARKIAEELRSTHPERAAARAVSEIGRVLKRFFPLEAGAANPNELPDRVSSDPD